MRWPPLTSSCILYLCRASAEAAAATTAATKLLFNATAAALAASGQDPTSVDAAFSREVLAELEARRHPALALRRQYRRMFALSCVSSRRVANWANADAHTRRLLALLREERDDIGAASSGPPSLDPAFALVVPLPAAETVSLSRTAVEFFHKEARSAADAAAAAAAAAAPLRRAGARLRVCYIGSEFGACVSVPSVGQLVQLS